MLETLNDLMKEQVRDLYSAENQLLKALPKMAKASTSDSLRAAFESHLEETRVHVERLQQVAELLEVKPGGKKCKAMEGLIAEGAEVLEEDGAGEVIDAALIAAAQRVEHYEISAYGSARALAERLNLEEIVDLLQTTLEEEETADEKLTTISLEEVLPAAAAGTEEQEAEQEQPASPPKKQAKGTKSRK